MLAKQRENERKRKGWMYFFIDIGIFSLSIVGTNIFLSCDVKNEKGKEDVLNTSIQESWVKSSAVNDAMPAATDQGRDADAAGFRSGSGGNRRVRVAKRGAGFPSLAGVG